MRTLMNISLVLDSYYHSQQFHLNPLVYGLCQEHYELSLSEFLCGHSSCSHRLLARLHSMNEILMGSSSMYADVLNHILGVCCK